MIEPPRRAAGVLTTMTLASMAGGMAWGIRGQYGHETGAMIAGILVGFVLMLLHGRKLSALSASRAIALFALGISVGGSMTYGQTVGLTHDGPLIGNSEAYRWGMIGLAVKGSVWIGLGAAMFGMGLSGKRYAILELCALFAAMLVALLIGVYLINSPFDPENRVLPAIYFSDHWYWEPDVDRPRPERWGGLVAALALLLVYLGCIKKDKLGLFLGLWGVLGGAIGFPAGQSIQSFHAWHSDWISSLPTHAFSQYFNWWNMMETVFGGVFGAIVGLGCWFHRARICSDSKPVVRMNPSAETVLLSVHIVLLSAWNFLSVDALDLVADHALPMIVLPTVCVMTGRYWPFFVALPIVMLPIAGKTVRQLVYNEPSNNLVVGWFTYFVVPLAVATALAMVFAMRSKAAEGSSSFLRVGLVANTWLYFGLNFAFFHFPWPWQAWTGRTPNGLLFLICAISLTGAAIWLRGNAEESF